MLPYFDSNLPFCECRLAALQLSCPQCVYARVFDHFVAVYAGPCACQPPICTYVCAGHLQELLPDIVLILGSEVLVDWIKHAFLLKFNNIEPEVCACVYILCC